MVAVTCLGSFSGKMQKLQKHSKPAYINFVLALHVLDWGVAAAAAVHNGVLILQWCWVKHSVT